MDDITPWVPVIAEILKAAAETAAELINSLPPLDPTIQVDPSALEQAKETVPPIDTKPPSLYN